LARHTKSLHRSQPYQRALIANASASSSFSNELHNKTSTKDSVMTTYQYSKNNKISVAVAEDNDQDLFYIFEAIKQTQNYKMDIVAENGRDLILKLIAKKEQPKTILMDMQMPSCDGLLCTIICKKLFPRIKVIGLSSHTAPVVIGEFLAEGGDAFLTKYMLVKGSAPYMIYNDANVFEKALDRIYHNNEMYIDILSQFEEANDIRYTPTKEIIASKYPSLKENEILYLQLNTAGFTREQIALIMNTSLSNIKKCCTKLNKLFKTESSHDLARFSLSLGITKIVKLYQ
jgi:DNA-binding NarL/FixJ family response regulator